MFKVLKDFKGSPDGYTVVEYAAGTEVDLAPDLAKVALKEKWVKELSAKTRPAPVDDAAAEAIADAQAAEIARATANAAGELTPNAVSAAQ